MIFRLTSVRRADSPVSPYVQALSFWAIQSRADFQPLDSDRGGKTPTLSTSKSIGPTSLGDSRTSAARPYGRPYLPRLVMTYTQRTPRITSSEV